MLALLSEIPNVQIYLTTFEYPNALDLSRFDKADSRFEVVSLWQFGLGELLEDMGSDDLLLITGSLYFVSEVRQLLLNLGGTNEKKLRELFSIWMVCCLIQNRFIVRQI